MTDIEFFFVFYEIVIAGVPEVNIQNTVICTDLLPLKPLAKTVRVLTADPILELVFLFRNP